MSDEVLSTEQQVDKLNKQPREQTEAKSVRFVEDGIKTRYAGVFNIGLGVDEAVLIF